MALGFKWFWNSPWLIDYLVFIKRSIMNDKENSKKISQNNIKPFFIKLISISIAVLIIVNLIFNIIFAERLEKIDKILLLNNNQFRHEIKEKIKNELTDSLNKENILYEEDKILLYKIYLKLKKEFEALDKSKI